MTPNSRSMVACMNIFLLLSMHPIHAMRLNMADAVMTKAEETQELVKEFRRALQEDTQNITAQEEYIGESWASCSTRKADFVRRAEKTKARYEEALEDDKMDVFEAAGVLLKTRLVAKTLSAAEKKGCDWVQEKNVDRSSLDYLATETTAKSPCFEQTKAALMSAEKKPAAEQGAAMVGAMGIYLSKTCEPAAAPVEDPSASHNINNEEQVVEDEVTEGSEQLAEQASIYMKQKFKASSMLEGDALLQAEGFDLVELTAFTNKDTSSEEVTSALMELTNKLTTGDTFGEVMARVLGFIVMVILWALFCWVLLAIVMLILGVIMCMIKLIIVALMRLFKGDAWDLDYGGCVGWWIGALGRESGGSDIGISMCAVSAICGVAGHR